MLCIKMICECYFLPYPQHLRGKDHVSPPWEGGFLHGVYVLSILIELSFEFNGFIPTTAQCSLLITPFTAPHFLPLVWISLFVFLIPSLSSPFPKRRGQFCPFPYYPHPLKRECVVISHFNIDAITL